ncbi:MAG: tetratricopeptide repeat protein [Cyanobacteriota/Melainabacteria group bacterium]
MGVSNEDSRYYSVRGYAFLQEGKYPETISDFNTALKIEPSNLSALIYRGQALIDYGDSRAAVSALNEAIRLDPKEPYSYTCRALAYMKLNNDSRALEDVNKALTLDPGNANASRLRGIYYLEKEGDYQKAIVDLGRSLKADPSSTTCNASMSRAYMKLKLYDKAIEHWNNVIKVVTF